MERQALPCVARRSNPANVAAEGTETQVSRGRATGDEQTSMIREMPEPYVAVSQIDVVPLGQMNRTFLVAQVGTELHVVDQHTAHERVLFERLWRSWRDRLLVSQPLLLPEPLDVSVQKADLLRRRLHDLEQVGLSVEPFGSSSFLIRAAPLSLTHADAEAIVQDLIEDFEQWESLSSLEERIRADSGLIGLPWGCASRSAYGAPGNQAIDRRLGSRRADHDMSPRPAGGISSLLRRVGSDVQPDLGLSSTIAS